MKNTMKMTVCIKVLVFYIDIDEEYNEEDGVHYIDIDEEYNKDDDVH